MNDPLPGSELFGVSPDGTWEMPDQAEQSEAIKRARQLVDRVDDWMDMMRDIPSKDHSLKAALEATTTSLEEYDSAMNLLNPSEGEPSGTVSALKITNGRMARFAFRKQRLADAPDDAARQKLIDEWNRDDQDTRSPQVGRPRY